MAMNSASSATTIAGDGTKRRNRVMDPPTRVAARALSV